jgi:hypothetical protein
MPVTPGEIIQTNRGRQRLLNDEVARGLGVRKHYLDALWLTACLLRETTSLHILEYLTPLLLESPLLVLKSEISRVGGGLAQIDRGTPTETRIQPLVLVESPVDVVFLLSVFTWWPPNLHEGKAFYNVQVRSLTNARQSFPNPNEVFQDGLKILSIH